MQNDDDVLVWNEDVSALGYLHTGVCCISSGGRLVLQALAV